jgi:hypothetical protein
MAAIARHRQPQRAIVLGRGVASRLIEQALHNRCMAFSRRAPEARAIVEARETVRRPRHAQKDVQRRGTPRGAREVHRIAQPAATLGRQRMHSRLSQKPYCHSVVTAPQRQDQSRVAPGGCIDVLAPQQKFQNGQMAPIRAADHGSVVVCARLCSAVGEQQREHIRSAVQGSSAESCAVGARRAYGAQQQSDDVEMPRRGGFFEGCFASSNSDLVVRQKVGRHVLVITSTGNSKRLINGILGYRGQSGENSLHATQLSILRCRAERPRSSHDRIDRRVREACRQRRNVSTATGCP